MILFFIILHYIGQFLTLILFLGFLIRRRTCFIIPVLLHLSTSIVCYLLDFQSWVIFLIILIWLVSGIWLFQLRWHAELKKSLKVTLVIITLLHGLTFADAWHERLLQSGWYGLRIQHFEINDDYSIRVQKGGFSRFISVDLVNKTHPMNQKITPLRLEGSVFPIENAELIPLENDSVMIKIKYMDNSRETSARCTIYLPDYEVSNNF